ncbi:MAG: lysophospholipid acyltransferase family protein [Hydrogenophaga sp.]|uniref:lysophospholipid acyltransferase family protein n=1 Tax=Hydrogenophaga sp. TaxID=1904254 RepID=UPI002717ED12|nr:lysophospholipid acyltransferase family protein [Hydrogenophaga sp.]MDO9483364.1 lysophospholipid acyltransferase family protein [Hydrogenophaga sp.]MDO9571698.1 lysophospholipid acyltransferase family protein [Hydrogenophaga sp.]MDP2094457.1 lysophospholipid acyltransferase family protein [Hydrogenophaga sp.]MDP2221267.1 lysophospholipid acyltransferase family protein [Hydrogenophaga sp.]MDP3345929.1 lysophospholipid acyltransferase family protein [Hydrogenophaga sp.]
MSRLRATGRALRALGHVLRGLWIVRSEFAQLSPAQTQLLVRAWSRQMMDIMGVTLVVRGTPPAQGPALLVANHVSWLDILVMNAAQPARFVSKADVKHWPLLGALITGAGTLYIERESRRDAMRVVHHMAERLQAHDILAVFPEGTTGDGRAMLPFHANVFQAAIAVHAPVVPVALRFVDGASGQRSHAPVFIGDTTLIASIWTTLRANNLQAVVVYGESQTHNGRDRRTWAQDLHAEVERLLQPDPPPR